MALNVKIDVRYIAPADVKKEAEAEEGLVDDEVAQQRIAELKEAAAQIERNMDLIPLDSQAQTLLNLPPPEDEPD